MSSKAYFNRKHFCMAEVKINGSQNTFYVLSTSHRADTPASLVALVHAVSLLTECSLIMALSAPHCLHGLSLSSFLLSKFPGLFYILGFDREDPGWKRS